jgi:7-keto-8-aminopelargonate synthetase-like enzyme
MGGHAPVEELKRLQDRYGLFLYLDDSHSISAYGARGRGYVRTVFGELDDRTIVVASLGKAFGTAGGMVLTGSTKFRDLLSYFGGPLAWSQPINSAVLGAIRASARIHLTGELESLQLQLKSVLDCFDEAIPNANAGNGMPIRIIDLPSQTAAVQASSVLFAEGFYTSPVFFPIVAKGRSGIRVMGRANMAPAEISRFCEIARTFV